MRLTYDDEANAAYLYIGHTVAAGAAARTLMVEPGDMEDLIHLDFDEAGHLLGIEILDAQRLLPAAVLREAR